MSVAVDMIPKKKRTQDDDNEGAMTPNNTPLKKTKDSETAVTRFPEVFVCKCTHNPVFNENRGEFLRDKDESCSCLFCDVCVKRCAECRSIVCPSHGGDEPGNPVRRCSVWTCERIFCVHCDEQGSMFYSCDECSKDFCEFGNGETTCVDTGLSICAACDVKLCDECLRHERKSYIMCERCECVYCPECSEREFHVHDKFICSTCADDETK